MRSTGRRWSRSPWPTGAWGHSDSELITAVAPGQIIPRRSIGVDARPGRIILPPLLQLLLVVGGQARLPLGLGHAGDVRLPALLDLLRDLLQQRPQGQQVEHPVGREREPGAR